MVDDENRLQAPSLLAFVVLSCVGQQRRTLGTFEILADWLRTGCGLAKINFGLVRTVTAPPGGQLSLARTVA